MLSASVADAHQIKRTGLGVVPDVLNTRIFNEIIMVRNENPFRTGRQIRRREGMLVGISSGAAVWAALEVVKRFGSKCKMIVAFLPDAGEQYLSTPLFAV